MPAIPDFRDAIALVDHFAEEMKPVQPLDLSKLKVFPLSERRSLTRADEILIPPDSVPKPLPEELADQIRGAAQGIRAARDRGASVMLIYGAHLLRNGTALILDRLMEQGMAHASRDEWRGDDS